MKVMNQSEFDDAIKNGLDVEIYDDIEIIVNVGSPRIVSWGSSTPRIVSHGSSTPRIVSHGSSTPRIVSHGSSTPRIASYDSSAPRIVSYDSSAPRIESWGSSTPRIASWGSSTPRIVSHGSSTPRIESWGSSTPHIVSWDSSSPHIVSWYGSSPRIESWDYSVVISHGNNPKIKLGVRAQHIHQNPTYPSDIQSWCEMKNITINDGRIMLWKCVDKVGKDFRTGTIDYTVKDVDICDPKWDAEYRGECGYALHLADSPSSARSFVSSDDLINNARLIKVSVDINDCVCKGGSPCYPQKLRARACRFEEEFPIDYDEPMDWE